MPAETRAGERRVALVPDVVRRLVAGGWTVSVQTGAGARAFFPDPAYEDAGARVVASAGELYEGTGPGVVARVNPPDPAEAAGIPEGWIVVSFLQAASAAEALTTLMARKVTYLSFDLLPRISRAQAMDALSSQATVSGYRAALLGAEQLDKFFPMFMTAAGTVPPAKVLVMGVGVAGLQAIATARRLGAVVRAYDVRAAAREEAESLGASFVDLGVSAEGAGGYARELTPEELARQQAALLSEVAGSDVVITTAAVPGRKAPILVTEEMVDAMAPGAVVVDIAADSGGNCALTVPGQIVERGGTAVVGVANPPAAMPTHASFLFARNVQNVLSLLGRNGAVDPDWDDEIVAGMCVLRDGAVLHGPSAEILGVPAQAPSPAPGPGPDPGAAEVPGSDPQDPAGPPGAPGSSGPQDPLSTANPVGEESGEVAP